jgi:hypothetical protein
MEVDEAQRIVQSSSILYYFGGALTPFLVDLACMIIVRPLASLCLINEVKAGCMHLFNAEAEAALLRKKIVLAFVDITFPK